MESNREWSDRIIQRFDPTFRHRWEVYNELLCSLLSRETAWVDVGCGDNNLVRQFRHQAASAVGIDQLAPPDGTTTEFLRGDIYHLPLPSASVDLLTLRFVVEHLADIPAAFAEVVRVLRPGGYLLLLTTNLCSPFILLPKLIPPTVRNRLFTVLFRVESEKVFPVFHRLNTLHRIRRLRSLTLVRSLHIQDANYVRKWIFGLFFLWHLISRPRSLQWLRTNIVAVLRKE